jgi:hypothetical protein
MRIEADKEDVMLPIISRLYQQMIKICILSAVSRRGRDALIDIEDVEFGYNLVLYYFDNMKEKIESLVYTNQNERVYTEVLKYIPLKGGEGISKQKLALKTRALGKKKRDEILTELEENGEIFKDLITGDKGKQHLLYWRHR